MARAASTPSRDRRLPPRNNANANSSPTAAALQGALLAFNHATPPRTSPALKMADRSQVSLLDSDPDPPPELPEPGSIRDKIALFSANSTANGLSDRPKTATESLPDISRQKSPQQLAAEIAVGNSPAPSSKPTPVEVHRAQSHRNETSPNRDLPSPIPIRRTVVSPRLLEPSSNGLHGTSLPNSQSELRPVSPRVPTSPRPRITKPRPAPPVPRKPSPVFHEPIPNEHNSEPSLLPSFPLRSKASASTLSSERGPPLPPRRAATLPVKDAQEQQLISGRTKSPAWPSSPSTVSIYSQSQNPSSSSMIDNLTDVSKDGPSDAVAASSLASNRARQARKPSPPPPPPQRRRRSRSRSLLHLQHQAKKDRAPSPSPGSLQKTLRTQAKSDGEDESRYRRQHRNRIINKHPHKHQEGDRRRWRSEVTEKERKRYEGVWAANKGLLIPTNQVFTRRAPAQEVPPDMYPPAALEMVVNLVVQDIWSRSRLPAHVLEQIWDLVDRQKIGLLTRPEFVVGMWLIDQQLRGHKLPAEVPDSVWASVVRVPGISLDDLQYAK